MTNDADWESRMIAKYDEKIDAEKKKADEDLEKLAVALFEIIGVKPEKQPGGRLIVLGKSGRHCFIERKTEPGKVDKLITCPSCNKFYAVPVDSQEVLGDILRNGGPKHTECAPKR